MHCRYLQMCIRDSCDTIPDGEYDIIVDALFGIGLCRPAEGIYRETIEWINAQDAFVLAVDLPSGIETDTGAVLGCAVRADVTVTFGFWKRGLLFYPGCKMCIRDRSGASQRNR